MPAGRFKRKRLPAQTKLSEKDVQFLVKNTRYDERDVREWFSGFIEACPGGALDKEGIMSMYLMPRHQAQIFIDEMFGMFDVDGNGTVSFQEFVLATNMTSCGSIEDKMRWAFKIYDEDNSGSIELDELVQIIVTFYDLEDIPREDSEEHAKNIFQAMDVDGSGSLDEEEFVKGCTTDPDFCRVIQSSIEKLKTNQG